MKLNDDYNSAEEGTHLLRHCEKSRCHAWRILYHICIQLSQCHCQWPITEFPISSFIANHNISFISFNNNGLINKFTKLQHYTLREKANIICIQEASVDYLFNPRIGGYHMFIKPQLDGLYGLVTFDRYNITITELD